MATLRRRAPITTRYERLTPDQRQNSWRLLYTNIKPKLKDQGINSGGLPFDLGVHHYYYYMTGGQPLPSTLFIHYEYKTAYYAIAQFPRRPGSVVDVSHNGVPSLVDTMYEDEGDETRLRSKISFAKFYDISAYKSWCSVTEAKLRKRMQTFGIDADAADAAYEAWRRDHLAFRLSMKLEDCPKATLRGLKTVVDAFVRSGRRVGPRTPTSEYIDPAYIDADRDQDMTGDEEEEQEPASLMRPISSSDDKEGPEPMRPISSSDDEEEPEPMRPISSSDDEEAAEPMRPISSSDDDAA